MKTQIKFEKIICYIVLISCVVNFLFSLGITTDIYKLLDYEAFADGSITLFYDIQPFNSRLVINTILMIVLAVFLFITKTSSRRKYYISNFVITILVFVVNLIIALWAMKNIALYKNVFLTEVDFESWKTLSEIPNLNIKYTDSTFWLDSCKITFIVTIICSGVLVLNMIWKIMLMKYENKILSNSQVIIGEKL